ncbi:MAG: hypothetical protein GF421_06220 [Candidatus Aminicenantes bacterium]|nr:hypothetical protein [Candidatus Aminicenantes bacterium]
MTDSDREEWGRWDDLDRTSFGCKETDGYLSVYTGTAPLPSPVLRWLAQLAGVRLWSTEPDIVRATEDAALLVAERTGKRTFSLHKPMTPANSRKSKKTHELHMKKGEVRLFTTGY